MIKGIFHIGMVLILSSCAVLKGEKKDSYLLENQYISRVFKIENQHLRTKEIKNKVANKFIILKSCSEFQLRISQGTHTTQTDVILTGDDFKFISARSYKLKDGKSLEFLLQNIEHGLFITVCYELNNDDSFMHKYLKIKTSKDVTLERIDVDVISTPDSLQPYKLKKITAHGGRQWKPGLGQPLFTTDSATFWGIEFPAAFNYVKDSVMYCGYLWGREVKKGKSYTTYKAVVGVSDSYEYIDDAFYTYIDKIRVRPLRLRIQYNSWFDYHGKVSKEKFKKSVEKVYNELVVDRGVRPFSANVIDDGWEDTINWKDSVWKVNNKFDKGFASSLKVVKDTKSKLGLWLSPQCNFGARRAVNDMRKNGLEALDSWMSLAGEKYMGLLKARMIELTKIGVNYFKLDGCFGHLNTREFDLHGKEHGLPYMPQLGIEGLKANDKELNKSKYDELKTYYLVAGTEKLMDIFKAMGEVDPDIYIVISNGAWLSPWWLMHCDSVWMINAGDAAKGSGRTGELVYRDEVYHQIWQEEKTHYLMNSLFNHEPKKRKTGEKKEEFQDYLYMNMSRGTGFIELYLKTFLLAERDWDVLADGLKWAEHIFPTFKRSRMHGGSPKKKEVYGFTAWNKNQGYVSFHNPSKKQKKYTFTINRKFGVVKDSGKFYLSAPQKRYSRGLKKEYNYGDTITITLPPKGVKVLNFDKKIIKWNNK